MRLHVCEESSCFVRGVVVVVVDLLQQQESRYRVARLRRFGFHAMLVSSDKFHAAVVRFIHCSPQRSFYPLSADGFHGSFLERGRKWLVGIRGQGEVLNSNAQSRGYCQRPGAVVVAAQVLDVSARPAWYDNSSALSDTRRTAKCFSFA